MARNAYKYVTFYSPCEAANARKMNDFYTDLNDNAEERIISMGDLNASG